MTILKYRKYRKYRIKVRKSSDSLAAVRGFSLYPDIDQMRDRRDRLFLKNGRRTEQRACRDEQDIAVLVRAQISEDVPAQHGRAASASGAAGMNVLPLVKNHHAAVLMLRRNIDPLLQHQIVQEPRPDPPQIACKHCVIIIYIRIGRTKPPIYGVRRRR